uniref:Uncharacterized protein n=1 Tax=Oryza meridionalis TaxID=40149 RepID=A0A0E0C9U6_9ORYZ
MVSLISAHLLSLPSSARRSRPQSRPPLSPPAAAASCSFDLPRPRRLVADGNRRKGTMAAAIPPEASGLAHDLGSAAVTAGVALALLRFFEELAKRGVFEQKLNRKLVHIIIGMVFLLFWPLFRYEILIFSGQHKSPYWYSDIDALYSSGSYAPFLAAVAPGINIIRMLLLGLGVMKNEAMGTSQGSTVLCYYYNFCHFYILENLSNRYSPCLQLMCWGRYMHYFQLFGFIEESWSLALGFLVVSVTAALVESHPISTHLDDNLTVPLTSFLVGSLVF